MPASVAMGTEASAVVFVPGKLCEPRSSNGQHDYRTAFVSVQILKQLAPLVAGPERRVARAASAPAKRWIGRRSCRRRRYTARSVVGGRYSSGRRSTTRPLEVIQVKRSSA